MLFQIFRQQIQVVGNPTIAINKSAWLSSLNDTINNLIKDIQFLDILIVSHCFAVQK